jgi:AraC-like DNA-binding protein/mannose-6-phosphate isomerase-like protein (cupin superfamily)
MKTGIATASLRPAIRGDKKDLSNRKLTLEHTMREETPSRLLYISTSRYENDWTSFMHSHHFTEIFYIKSGEGHMQIENEQVPITPNSLILIGACIQHTEISDPRSPLDYYVLGVDGLLVEADKTGGYSVITATSQMPLIRQCFENIHHEMHSKNPGYAEICQHYLAILIQLICRKTHISSESFIVQNSSLECHKAKRYIETNYREKITLDTLSANCNITKYYLSHKFTELYGKSPMAYLTDVRIYVAKDLLKSTSYSIEEVASATGFSSSSYFTQTFQKNCGMSPQQYRKSDLLR